MNPIKWLNTFQRTTKTTGNAESVQSINVEKDASTLGGFFETHTKLSDEKSISSKLLEANRDWVYKNNDVIAKEVAGIEFELYQVNIVNGEFEYTEIEDHPLLQLLDKFNETTTKSDGIYTTQSHKKLTGDAFWLLDGNGINIQNIFTLQPDNVELDLGDFTNGSRRLVNGYKFKAIIDGKTQEEYYTPEQIIPFKNPDPSNMYRGKGVVEAAAETIDLDFLTTDLSKKFFKNGAITNFILSTEGKLQEAQLKRLKAEFKSAFGGSKNAFKTMILGGGLKPTQIQASNRDMEFLAQLEWYRDKIMVLFGNTKASLGIIDDVNRASHESSIIAWKRNSVKPDMQSICDTLNEYLVPRYGDNLLLTFEDPIPEDRAGLLEEVKLLTEQQLVSRNEARQMLGLSPADGEEHDAIPIPTQMPTNLQNIDVPKILRSRGMYKKLKDFRRYKEIGKGIAEIQLKKKKSSEVITVKETPKPIHERFTNEEIKDYATKQLNAVEEVEARFKNKVEQFIGHMIKMALANYPEHQPKQYSKDLFNEDDLLLQAELNFTPLLQDIASISGHQALSLIGSKEPYFANRMEADIKANVKRFTQSMIETDRQKIVDIIKNGLEEGLAIPTIRNNITDSFKETYTPNQAERISRTEVIRTSNESALDAWKQSGVVEGKQWLATSDDRTDEDCDALDGEIVYELDGDFYDSSNEFQNGDPPLHPDCRCVVIPVLDAQKKFDTETFQLIKNLESQIDKRTKEFKDLQAKDLEKEQYIVELEKIIGI